MIDDGNELDLALLLPEWLLKGNVQITPVFTKSLVELFGESDLYKAVIEVATNFRQDCHTLQGMYGKAGIVSVQPSSEIEVEAYIHGLDNGEYHIDYCKGMNTAHLRFVVVHEIGHTFFFGHKGKNKIPYRIHGHSDSDTLLCEEIFCDMFAAAVLVQPSVLSSHLQSGHCDMAILKKLMSVCDISFQGICIALEVYGYRKAIPMQ